MLTIRHLACLVLVLLLASCVPLPPVAPPQPAEARGPTSEAPAGRPLGPLGESGRDDDLAFSPDASMLAAAHDGRIRLYRIATGKLVAEIKPDLELIADLAFSPDGNLLAAGGGERYGPIPGSPKVQVWDVATRERVLQLTGSDLVAEVAFSPDGSVLGTGDSYFWGPGDAKLWDLATGSLVSELNDARIRAIGFLGDGTFQAVSGGMAGTAIWNVAGNKVTRRFNDFSELVAVSPDFGLVATYQPEASSLRVWTASTGASLTITQGVDDRPRRLIFSPDGRILVAETMNDAGEPGRVRLWNTQTGELLSVLGFDVDSVAFSPDGRLLATSGLRGPIMLWDVPDLVRAGE